MLTQHMYVIGREPEGSVGTKLVNKAIGNFWEGIVRKYVIALD